MKKIFTFKGHGYAHRAINGHVYTYNISDEIEKILITGLASAERYDLSEEDQKALFDEKMRLSHDHE